MLPGSQKKKPLSKRKLILSRSRLTQYWLETTDSILFTLSTGPLSTTIVQNLHVVLVDAFDALIEMG